MDDAIRQETPMGKTVPVDPVTYGAYINLLLKAFGHVHTYYSEKGQEVQTPEEISMGVYTEKFIESVRALRLKFRWSPLHFAKPGIDIKDSGFPGFYDIMRLETDLTSRSERLPKLPEMETLKDAFVNHVMRTPSDPEMRSKHEQRSADFRWQVAERAYLEMLDLRTIFFMFTPGKLFPVTLDVAARREDRRTYHFSWGCYDPDRNRPCVYFMLFEQDADAPPLESEESSEYVQFLRIVQHIGGRAPENLGAMAAAFDESFSTLYPKVLKRIVIGPLVSPLLYGGEQQPGALATKVLPLFGAAQIPEDEFLLFFSTEIVTSDREEMSSSLRSLFTGRQKARQIFYVPKNDKKLLRRGASFVSTYALMPHRLRQHIGRGASGAIPEFADVEFLTYQPKPQSEVSHAG